jgi:leucyl-tRNA synthetase
MQINRFACGPEGMNRGLVLRYMELSCLLLVPITPHYCEHVWSALLKRQGSVLRAGWPAAAEPDFIMQRAAQYIEGEIFWQVSVGLLAVCMRYAY